MTQRYVCVHGHFYQPPRENPWLEHVEPQDSARPFHDWNDRITAECYAPNGACRLLDGEGWIAEVVNNYARMSFNMGPTLLSWMEAKAPTAYANIIAADKESRERFSGHGSAVAQVYNHIILPLANRRDKQTQVIWGMRDFERRFGRAPEGMWLAETAADTETLEVLAEQGIKYTILSPYQARSFRKQGDQEWQNVEGGRVDPSRAYRVDLPGGKQIAVFFYDGPISQGIAFEGLLSSGDKLVDRLKGAFSDARQGPQLIHIATDGESYGHHHRHGDMALGYALRRLEKDENAKLTCYGEFLEKHPPEHEAQIVEASAWSCSHGVDRWRKHCGCCAGGRPGWNQNWRQPLREALDGLRDGMTPGYERAAQGLLKDPWAARDGYIDVILDRSKESVDRFLGEHAGRDLSPEERVKALKLLEMQRQSQLMYTSCGWFFDELSGLETTQVMRYAARAIQLAKDVLGEDLEAAFVEKLGTARSNVPELKDGRRIYEKMVKPSSIDLQRVGAHYALSSLFQEYREKDRTYCFRVEREEHRVRSAGAARLAQGRARITSEITEESTSLCYGALHLGDHNISGGVRPASECDSFAARAKELEEVFDRMDVPELVRAVDRSFGAGAYTLRLLFREEQRRIAGEILKAKRERAEAALRALYDEFAPLMRFLAELEIPPPPSLAAGAEFVIASNLARIAVDGEEPDPAQVRALLDEAGRSGIKPHQDELQDGLRRAAKGLARRLVEAPEDARVLAKLESLADLGQDLGIEIDFWHVQNAFFDTILQRLPDARARAQGGDEGARAWLERVKALSEKLKIRIPEAPQVPPVAAAA